MKYNKFIKSCKNKDYSNLITNKHHIIPLSQGGLNIKDNIIELSVYDHFWAHVYYAREFCKCYGAPQQILRYYKSNKEYNEQEWNELAKIAKEFCRKRMIGKKQTKDQIENRANKIRGQKRSLDVRKKMSESRKKLFMNGYKFSDHQLKLMSKNRKGIRHTKIAKEKISLAVKGKTYEERFGKERAKEIKNKLSIAKLNHKFTDKHREKISKSLKGRKQPIELVKKRAESLKKTHALKKLKKENIIV